MATGNLLYLDIGEFEGGKVIRGGALVVDATTEPLEFRCTNGVRPTRLQTILWGKRLEGYIATDLIAKPLIKALRQVFSAVIVRERNFLDLRAGVEVPVIELHRDSKIAFDSAAAKQSDPAAIEGTVAEGGPAAPDPAGATSTPFLTNPSGHFEPIILRCHESHPDDIKAVREALQPVFLRRDVMEPFERIAQALKVVHEQNPKD